MNPKTVSISELHTLFTKLSKEMMRDHDRRFSELIKSIKRTSTEMANIAQKFGSGVKNAWGTIDKTASEQGLRLAQSIEQTARELSQIQTGSSYDEARRFHQTSVAALNKVIIASRKYLPKIHRMLKSEIAALNSSLLKLEESINALQKSIDKSPGAELAALEREITAITKEHEQLNKFRSQGNEIGIQMAKLTGEANASSTQKASLLQNPKFHELNSTEEKLNSVREGARQLLQPLMKPLLKLERVTANRKSPNIDATVLRNIIQDPVETILTAHPDTVASTLNSLRWAFNTRELEVDKRRRRKAEECIKEVTETMPTFRTTCAKLKVRIEEATKELRSSGLLAEMDRLDNSLNANRSRLEKLKAEHDENRRKIQELISSASKHESSIESQILALFKEHVRINATQPV